MSNIILSDKELEVLLTTPKILSENNRKKLSMRKTEDAHLRADVELESNLDCSFYLKTRESIHDPMDYSAILSVKLKTGEQFNLIRCNGSSHQHPNQLENEIIWGTHIHIATERYMNLGSQPERYAIATDEYSNLEAAILHLLKLAHINFGSTDIGETLF